MGSKLFLGVIKMFLEDGSGFTNLRMLRKLHFIKVNFMVYKLSLNKAIIKKCLRKNNNVSWFKAHVEGKY